MGGMIWRSAVFASCVMLAALALAGCSGDEDVADQVSSAVETATEAIPQTVEVELAELNGSGQSGAATLEPSNDGHLNVTIELSGNQDESQPADLHEGSCPDHGDVVALLNDVVDGTSATDIVFSLEDVASADSPGYAIDVHRSNDLPTVVACGDITDVSLP